MWSCCPFLPGRPSSRLRPPRGVFFTGRFLQTLFTHQSCAACWGQPWVSLRLLPVGARPANRGCLGPQERSHSLLRMSPGSPCSYAALKPPPGHRPGSRPAHLPCVPFRGPSVPSRQHLEAPGFMCLVCAPLLLAEKANPGPVVHGLDVEVYGMGFYVFPGTNLDDADVEEEQSENRSPASWG